ncbi:MAG: exosortase [Acidobacteriaceae bacterium]|nr:exosortase [Acidobacteriaceae bacterium]
MELASTPASERSDNRRLVLLQAGLLLILITWLYAPMASRLLVECWHDPNSTYGLFVPIISLFMLWEDRAGFAKLPLKPSWTGLAMLLFAALALVIGTMSSEFFLSRLSFLFLLSGIIVFLAGWRHLFAMLFPLGFLVLMAPSPTVVDWLTLPLQLTASTTAAFLLKLAGVSVIQQGNILLVPGARLQVAEACSGIQSLFCLFSLAIVYGHVVEKKIKIRVLLALAAIPISVAANGLRIATAAIALQYWGLEKTQGIVHVFSGWIVFMASLTLLFGLHKIIATSAAGTRGFAAHASLP